MKTRNSKLRKFFCISCKDSFSAFSVSRGVNENDDIKTGSCSSCNSLFTGVSSSKARIGKVEAYYKREEKSKK